MRIMVVRLGAWGDSIIITPLLRHLKELGHEVYLNTSETGLDILKHNPYIDKFLPYVSNSVDDSKLQEYWSNLAKENGCEKTINLCESIERALSFHPIDPMYSWTKKERSERGDKNFYEHTFTFAGYDWKDARSLKPDMFFTDEEEEKMRNFFAQDKKAFWVLWGLSGSGLNKAYPHADYVIAKLLKHHKQVKVVTVGDELCQILEALKDKRVIRRAGVWTMRESSLATKYVNLVVAPDTGLIHASGCFDTPKICIVGSNTKNQIAKHFVNDFSIEADPKLVACAPCHRQIHQPSQQCPIDTVHYLPKCMSLGIDPDKVYERCSDVIHRYEESRSLQGV